MTTDPSARFWRRICKEHAAEIVHAFKSPGHVAFIEDDKSGSAAAQQNYVYVKHNNGSAWVQDGGALNRDLSTFTMASSVSGTACGSTPYVAWTEFTTNNFSADTNDHAYVSSFNGTSWVAVGGNINQSASLGYAKDIAITCLGTTPYVAFAEHTLLGVAKVYLKHWNGSSWILDATLNRDSSTGYESLGRFIVGFEHCELLQFYQPGVRRIHRGPQSVMGDKVDRFLRVCL
jgi:hypothetical protein